MWPFRQKPDISRLKQEKNTAAVIEALGDRDWRIRRDAARALGEAKDPEAVAGLTICLLGDSHWLVRWSAAEALREIGDPRACPDLELSMREDGNRRVRIVSKWAVAELEKRKT